MAWTYVIANLGQNGKDAVRFLIQDTQTARPLLQDEEISYTLTTEANVYMAAAMCCDILVTKAGNLKTKWVGNLRLTYDPSHYRGLALTLRARGASNQVPMVGGISVSDKLVQQMDSDAVQPRAFRTEMDNSRADQPTPGGDQGGSFFQVP